MHAGTEEATWPSTNKSIVFQRHLVGEVMNDNVMSPHTKVASMVCETKIR